MSYGGNDLIGSGCSITAADLATKMANAIEHTRDALYPTATTYVLAGYCQVYDNVDCPNGASDFSALDDALTSLASTYANTNVKIFNHMTVCGGTSSSYSDESYFQDAIHLNAKGYCTYFTQSDIATELQCGSQASIDCNSNPPSLCGIGDGNCAEDTPACPNPEATTTSTPLTPTTTSTPSTPTTTSAPSTPTTTSAPSTPTTTSAPSNPSPSPSPSPSGGDSDNDGDDSDNSSSSDSDSTILFIGVGVGAVIGIVVLAAVLYSCVGRSRK